MSPGILQRFYRFCTHTFNTLSKVDIYLYYQFHGESQLLSDAALSIAIGCEIKWLYNSARRLALPVRRSSADAIWWRLVHHLAIDLGIPLVNAARSADTLIVTGVAPGRVRLRATRDGSVSVSIDLDRFHDGAALAIAAAIYLAVPKARGRPRKHSGNEAVAALSQSEMEEIVRLRALGTSKRLERAVTLGSGMDLPESPAAVVVRELLSAGIPFVVAGTTAAAFHCAPWPAEHLDLCVDASGRNAAAVARTLNRLGAIPRGTGVRDGFCVDAAIVGATPILALRIKDVSLNLFAALSGIGEYPQVEQLSIQVPMDWGQIRVLTIPGLLKSGTPGPVSEGAAKQARWIQFAASQDSPSGTR